MNDDELGIEWIYILSAAERGQKEDDIKLRAIKILQEKLHCQVHIINTELVVNDLIGEPMAYLRMNVLRLK